MPNREPKTDKGSKYGFLNESALVFDDISSEAFREYVFPNGTKYRIESPILLNVSASGGHRLYAKDGMSHYVQPREGWAIRWKSLPDQPNFVK